MEWSGGWGGASTAGLAGLGQVAGWGNSGLEQAPSWLGEEGGTTEGRARMQAGDTLALSGKGKPKAEPGQPRTQRRAPATEPGDVEGHDDAADVGTQRIHSAEDVAGEPVAVDPHRKGAAEGLRKAALRVIVGGVHIHLQTCMERSAAMQGSLAAGGGAHLVAPRRQLHRRIHNQPLCPCTQHQCVSWLLGSMSRLSRAPPKPRSGWQKATRRG